MAVPAVHTRRRSGPGPVHAALADCASPGPGRSPRRLTTCHGRDATGSTSVASRDRRSRSRRATAKSTLTTSALRVVCAPAALRPRVGTMSTARPSRSTARRSRINGAGRAAPSGTAWRARAAIATSGWATRPGRSTAARPTAFARWHSTHWATTRETSDPLYKPWPYLIVREAGGISYGLFYDTLATATFDLGCRA